jgi:hypothetical protein
MYLSGMNPSAGVVPKLADFVGLGFYARELLADGGVLVASRPAG